MKTLKIDWLEACDKCGSSVHTVSTNKGSEEWLYDGDKVSCDCGQCGEVECEGGEAWVNWFEIKDSEKLPESVIQSLKEVS